jgi:hypothetical protein
MTLERLDMAYLKFDQTVLSTLVNTKATYLKFSFLKRKDNAYPKLFINART